MPVIVRYIVSIALILTLSVASIWFGNELAIEYFQYENSIHFIWFSAITYLAPGIFSFPLIFFVLAILKGQEQATTLCSKYLYLYKYLLGISLLILISFPLIYVNILESKGYVACKGTPHGYMPGIGKQYVTDLSLCNQ
ncbi:hypothetical protein ACXZ7B_27050 [Vibrio owensii]